MTDSDIAAVLEKHNLPSNVGQLIGAKFLFRGKDKSAPELPVIFAGSIMGVSLTKGEEPMIVIEVSNTTIDAPRTWKYGDNDPGPDPGEYTFVAVGTIEVRSPKDRSSGVSVTVNLNADVGGDDPMGYCIPGVLSLL